MQGWPVTVEQEGCKPYVKHKLELSVLDGFLLWGSRVIVPPAGRAQVMEEPHDAHPGVSRMKSLARSFVWWPGMDRALEDQVKACSQCQSNQKMPAPAPLHPWQWPGHPWSRLHIDFAGPFMGKMFLVMVDAHSKGLEAHIMSNITAPVTTETLRGIFALHGLPDMIVTDNGPTFISEVFKEFNEKNGIHHVCTAPYHPASNGLAERPVETSKDGLRKMSRHSLETKLSRFLFQYRITPHSSATGVPPAQMLLGKRLKSHLDLLYPDIRVRVVRSQEEQKARWDQHVTERLFHSGDSVYVKMFATGSPWLPGVIHHQMGPVSFVVDLSDGRQVRRHQDHLRVRYDARGKCQGVSHKDSVNSSGEFVMEQPEVAHKEMPEPTKVTPDGLSVQAAPPAPAPRSGNTTPELRRSKRQHKPPDSMTY